MSHFDKCRIWSGPWLNAWRLPAFVSSLHLVCKTHYPMEYLFMSILLWLTAHFLEEQCCVCPLAFMCVLLLKMLGHNIQLPGNSDKDFGFIPQLFLFWEILFLHSCHFQIPQWDFFFPPLFKMLPSFDSFVSSHLDTILSHQTVFSINLDWSQTRRFAHYHKIMGCGYWGDPGKTWSRNTTKICISFSSFHTYSFLPSFLSTPYLHILQTSFSPASCISHFRAQIRDHQIYCWYFTQQGPSLIKSNTC